MDNESDVYIGQIMYSTGDSFVGVLSFKRFDAPDEPPIRIRQGYVARSRIKECGNRVVVLQTTTRNNDGELYAVKAVPLPYEVVQNLRDMIFDDYIKQLKESFKVGK